MKQSGFYFENIAEFNGKNNDKIQKIVQASNDDKKITLLNIALKATNQNSTNTGKYKNMSIYN